MAELYEYEYECNGMVLYFFEHHVNGVTFLSARVNNQTTYQRVNGKWSRVVTENRNQLTQAQLEQVWERHVASLIVDGAPKSFDPWRKQWVTAEE